MRLKNSSRKAVQHMAVEIFRLVGSIFVDNEQANKSISKTDEKAQGVGKTLLGGIKKAGKWGAAIVAGAAAAATAVSGLAATTVSSYADYEQLIGGVETLFKDSAGIVEGYAKNAYKTAGMTANQYMETVTSFSASLLQGLNGDTAAAAKVADMAITDMSDNANKMGTDMQSIQNAYQGFAKQNYTMLDNLKLGYGGTKTEMERLLADASRLSGVKYNIDNLNDVYEAIHVIQGEMGITGTTAKEATSTISGSINMIKAKLSDFKTTIGASIAPVVQSFLTMAIDNLPVLEGLINQGVPVVSNLMQTLLPPTMQLAQTLLPLILSLITSLLPPVQQILLAVLPVIIQLLDTLLPPMIQIVDTLLPPLLGLLQPLLDLLQPLITLIQPILDLVLAILQPLAQLITDLLTPLISVISRVIEAALIPLQTRFTLLSGVLSGTFNAAVGLVLGAANTIKGVFSGLIRFIKGVFTGDWKGAWEGVKKIFSSIWEGIKTAFKAPINWIIDGINSFIRGVNRIKIPIGSLSSAAVDFLSERFLGWPLAASSRRGKPASWRATAQKRLSRLRITANGSTVWQKICRGQGLAVTIRSWRSCSGCKIYWNSSPVCASICIRTNLLASWLNRWMSVWQSCRRRK